jgi:membrane fusion protein
LGAVMTLPLFRHEVAEARRDSWLGETHLAQPISIRLTVILCFAFILSTIFYIVLGSYTRRVHAQGLLTPNVGLMTLASPVAGRVGSSAVKEGDRVERGQLLYVIDLDAVSANGPTQKQVIRELERQKRSMDKQRELRVATAETEKKSLAEQIGNLKAQSDELAKQIEIQGQLVPPLKRRVEVLAKALSDGLARAADLHSQNYLYMQATAQLAQFKQAALQIKGRLEDLETQYINFDDKLARDLAEMDRAAAQLAQQKAESEAKRAIEIRAPTNGLLTSIRVQAGQSVAAGATLLTLLPSEGRLQANLYVDSSAIGFIETGAAVMLRYAAFPFQRFGLYRGVVTEVTRAPLDASDAPTGVNVSKDGANRGVYRVVVRPEQDTVMAYGEERRLEAGMRVEADIALEKRALYRWLLDPLYRAKRSMDLVTEGG